MGIQADVTFHPSWWHKNAKVNFNRDFFEDPHYRIDADIRMRKILYDKFGDLGLGEKSPVPRPIIGSDLIASGYLYSGILGCEIRYSDGNPPEVICANMTDGEVWNLISPDPELSDLWKNLQFQIDFLEKEFGRVIPCVNLMGIQNIALDLRGSQLFIDYYTNPSLAHHLLQVSTELSIEIGKRLRRLSPNISAGVTGIVKKTLPDVYLTSNCSVDMVSLDMYNDFLLQYDLKLAENFRPFGIHHCGKKMENVAEGYAKIEHLAFAEAGAGSDIAFVREKLPKAHINARYSPAKLMDVKEDEMKADIAKMIKNGAPLNLFSISCVGIDKNISDEKIRMFLEACQKAKE